MLLVKVLGFGGLDVAGGKAIDDFLDLVSLKMMMMTLMMITLMMMILMMMMMILMMMMMMMTRSIILITARICQPHGVVWSW